MRSFPSTGDTLRKESGSKPIPWIDEFLYIRDKQVRSKVCWKCQHFAERCRGSATTDDGSINSTSGEYNHERNPINVEVWKFFRWSEDRPTNHTRVSSLYYLQCIFRIKWECCCRSTTNQQHKLSIRRMRQEEQCELAVGNHRRGLIFYEVHTKTNKAEPFLLFDSADAEDRMLIFSNQNDLWLLVSCKHHFMDGFKTVPVPAAVLYVFMAWKQLCHAFGFCVITE